VLCVSILVSEFTSDRSPSLEAINQASGSRQRAKTDANMLSIQATLAFPVGSSSKWFLGRVHLTQPKPKHLSLLAVQVEEQCPCLAPEAEVETGGYAEFDAVIIDHEEDCEAALPTIAKTCGDMTKLRPAGNLSGLEATTAAPSAPSASASFSSSSTGASNAAAGQADEELFTFDAQSCMTGEPAAKRAKILFPELVPATSGSSSSSAGIGTSSHRIDLTITEGIATIDFSRLEWKAHSVRTTTTSSASSSNESTAELPYSQHLLQRRWKKRSKTAAAGSSSSSAVSSSSSSDCCDDGDHHHHQAAEHHQEAKGTPSEAKAASTADFAASSQASGGGGWINPRAARRQQQRHERLTMR
jgi:hypothetical protein